KIRLKNTSPLLFFFPGKQIFPRASQEQQRNNRSLQSSDNRELSRCSCLSDRASSAQQPRRQRRQQCAQQQAKQHAKRKKHHVTRDVHTSDVCDASERQRRLSHRAARSSSSWTLPAR